MYPDNLQLEVILDHMNDNTIYFMNKDTMSYFNVLTKS